MKTKQNPNALSLMFLGDSGYGNIAFSGLHSNVLSAQFLFYCRIKSNVSIAKIDLAMKSESTICRAFLYICFGFGFGWVFFFFFGAGNHLSQQLFLATDFIWLRALNLSVQHLNICIIIPHLLHKAVM